MRSPLFVLMLLALLAVPGVAQGAGPCETPRTAVAHFLDNLQPDLYRPAEAVQCFDFSAGPSALKDQIRVARELLGVLDGQGKFVVYTDIPGTTDYTDPTSGLARVVLFPSLPEIRLEKMGDDWKMSAATISATPKLYERTYRVPIQRMAQRLPPTFSQPVLGIAIWKWCGLALLFALAGLGGLVFRFVLGRFMRSTAGRFFESWNLDYERAILRWSARLVTAGVAAMLLPNLALPVRVNQVLFVILEFAACIAAVLIVHSLVDFVADALARRAAATEGTMDDALVPLIRRGAKLLVDVTGGLFVLQNLDVDIGSLVATLGIGGLAFALAAKDTLSNLFGFLTIVADRPFQIGDWVDIDGSEGTVEEVGIRSTRIRTFYDSLVALPNSTVAGAKIDNMGRRRRRRFKSHLGVTYDTKSTQMTDFVDGIRASIAAHPLMAKNPDVHLHQMSSSSLDVLVYAFIEAATWTEELATRQELMLEWMALAEKLGVEFAFPTQTVHLADQAHLAEQAPPA
jgi:MscS family membrane protein